MGSTIAEAQEKVDKAVRLRKGYSMVWQGDFENQQRATRRLEQVVPISLLLIFILLFVMFGNLKDAGLVFLNVPFAIVGGVIALHLTGDEFQHLGGYRLYRVVWHLYPGRRTADHRLQAQPRAYAQSE